MYATTSNWTTVQTGGQPQAQGSTKNSAWENADAALKGTQQAAQPNQQATHAQQPGYGYQQPQYPYGYQGYPPYNYATATGAPQQQSTLYAHQQQQQQQQYAAYQQYYANIHASAPATAATPRAWAGAAPPRPPPSAVSSTGGSSSLTSSSYASAVKTAAPVPVSSNPNQWAWSTGKSGPKQLPVTMSKQQGGKTGLKFALGKKPVKAGVPAMAKATGGGTAAIFSANDDGDDDDDNGSNAKEAFIPAGKKPSKETSNNGKAMPADQWPKSLQSYVARTFGRCTSDQQRNNAEKRLREIILKATESSTIFTTNWFSTPLPDVTSAPPPPVPTKAITKAATSRLSYTTSVPQQQQGGTTQGTTTQNGKAKKRNKRGAKEFEMQVDAAVLNNRANRFAKTNKRPRRVSTAYIPPVEDSDFSYDGAIAVRGLCRDLEKPFLRLNTAPDPLKVRPPEVLRESLEHVKRRWKATNDYKWTCDQMKSIRQDLTVQCVQDDFTVVVYETHARIALEKADHAEFNQCQVQLRNLYQTDVRGSRSEFVGYRVLYNIFTNNNVEQLTTLAEIHEPDFKGDSSSRSILHALKVREAFASGNYIKFFRLYQDAPLMGGYLMDLFVLRERKRSLLKITHSFRPQIAVTTIQEWLAFEDKNSCLDFLNEMHVVFEIDRKTKTKASVNCKESYSILLEASKETKGLAAWAK